MMNGNKTPQTKQVVERSSVSDYFSACIHGNLAMPEPAKETYTCY